MTCGYYYMREFGTDVASEINQYLREQIRHETKRCHLSLTNDFIQRTNISFTKFFLRIPHKYNKTVCNQSVLSDDTQK